MNKTTKIGKKMGRFTKILKEKEQKEKLSKHPLKNESEDIRKDYIQALVLLANEDDNFSEEEKEHIKFLLDLIDLDKSLIDEFDKFAKEASEDELFDFIERLKKLDEKIKMQIIVESCVVAFKDDNLDESEENIIDEYLDILELQDKKDEIMFIAKTLSYKDVDNAILTYLVYKDLYTQFEYMFDILSIDAKKELKELYNFEWIEFRLDKGEVIDNNLVAKKPITIRQYCTYLNYLILNKELKQIINTEEFEYIGNKKFILMKNPLNHNLEFKSSFFIYDKEKQDDYIQIQPSEAILDNFINFINNNIDNKLFILEIIGRKEYQASMLKLNKSALSLLIKDTEEMFYTKSTWEYKSSSQNYRYIRCFGKSEHIKDNYPKNNSVFRVMKQNKEEEQ